MEAFLEYYARVNSGLIDLIDHIPDERLDWCPRPGAWSFRAILAHIVQARDELLDEADVPETQPPMSRDITKEELRKQLQRSWARVARFGADRAKTTAPIVTPSGDALPGSWVPYTRLAHDVHHRSEMLCYLAELGVAASDIESFAAWGPQPHPLER